MPLINTITIDYCQILLSDSCPLGPLVATSSLLPSASYYLQKGLLDESCGILLIPEQPVGVGKACGRTLEISTVNKPFYDYDLSGRKGHMPLTLHLRRVVTTARLANLCAAAQQPEALSSSQLGSVCKGHVQLLHQHFPLHLVTDSIFALGELSLFLSQSCTFGCPRVEHLT